MNASGTTTIARIPDDIAKAVLLPSSYVDLWRTVYPAFRWLRANAPVAEAEIEGYDRVWVLSSHEAVRSVLRDADLFHNADFNIMLQPKVGDAYLRDLLGGHTKVMKNLSYMEPPEHATYRGATAFAFQPAQIRRFQSRFAEVARNAIDRLFEDYPGECDIVEALTSRFPLQIIMELLGIATSDYDYMSRLTQETFGGDDPDFRREGVDATPEAMARQWNAGVQDFYRYFLDIKASRSAQPLDDMSTSMFGATMEDGSALPESIQVTLTMSIAIAGHDTVNTALAAAFHGLATHSDQLRAVQQDPKLIPLLVEESIRWATPTKHFMRNATRDAEVGGMPIAAGDRLFCSLASANMDEAVFDHPERFDVTRRPNLHVAFGFGPHLCLGQHIARMELQALFKELLPRLESLELAGEPSLKTTNFVSGFKSLPIRFTARS